MSYVKQCLEIRMQHVTPTNKQNFKPQESMQCSCHNINPKPILCACSIRQDKKRRIEHKNYFGILVGLQEWIMDPIRIVITNQNVKVTQTKNLLATRYLQQINSTVNQKKNTIRLIFLTSLMASTIMLIIEITTTMSRMATIVTILTMIKTMKIKRRHK